MDGVIKLAPEKFEPYILGTADHIWFGILKREFKTKKHTVKEWWDVIETLKSRPVK